MTEFGRTLAKLMAIRDVFEWKELSEVLAKQAHYTISGPAISNYARNKRQPPRTFFDATRRALSLTDDMWILLLNSYYESEQLTPDEAKLRAALFERWLVDTEAENLRGTGSKN